VRKGFLCVGNPHVLLFELGQKDDVMAPGQNANRLLAIWKVRPRFRKGPHVLEIRGREALHLGECRPQIGRNLLDYAGPSTRLGLTFKQSLAIMPAGLKIPSIGLAPDENKFAGCTIMFSL
jgi:hypothetical protein